MKSSKLLVKELETYSGISGAARIISGTISGTPAAVSGNTGNINASLM
jgi:hypothetical protein